MVISAPDRPWPARSDAATPRVAPDSPVPHPPPQPEPAHLGRILLFFALAALAATLLHAAVNVGLRRIPTGRYGVWNKAVTGRINADIVISGSSRALVHYDTRILADVTGLSVFNLAQNASRTDMQLAFLKEYLEHNRAPRIVIQNLDLHTLAVTPENEVYVPSAYVPYLEKKHIYEALLKIDKDAWKWKYIPLYGYVVEDMRLTWITGLCGLLGWAPQESRFNGFEPRNREWTSEFERFRAANPTGIDVEMSSEGTAALAELIDLCHDRGILIILVYSPEYWEMLPLARNRSRIFKEFTRLAEQAGAPLWDYSESPLTKDQNLFYNSQHMNSKGAKAFSTDLGQRLHPLLQPTP